MTCLRSTQTFSPSRQPKPLRSIPCKDSFLKQHIELLKMASSLNLSVRNFRINQQTAGIPMESVSGSSTAVYTGSFSMDYMIQLLRDAENPPTHAALGLGLSMLANRLSWFFNFRGPSIGLDTACSSAATAVDLACQSLRNGSSDMVRLLGPYIYEAIYLQL